MKRFCVLFILFFQVVAAQPTADSLSAELRRAGNDIRRAELLNQLADAVKNSDPAQLSYYARRALELSRAIGYKTAEGHALVNLGNAGIVSGNYLEAANRFSEAQSLFETIKGKDEAEDRMIKIGLGRSYAGLGVVFSEQSSYARALQYYFKAARIYEAIKDTRSLGRLHNNIGIAFQSQGEDFKALEYFLKCLRAQQTADDPTAAVTLTNIGNIYLRRNDLKNAAAHYDKALAVYRRHPNPRGEGELQNNLGLYRQKSGDRVGGEQHFRKAIALFRSIDDRFGTADTYYYLSNLYMEEAKWPAAIEAASQSLALAKQTQVQEQIRNAEKNLSVLYERMGDPAEALRHYRHYTVAQDSLNDLETARNSVRAEMDFEFEKREAVRKKESEKREILYMEQSKRHRLEIVFSILTVMLLAGLAFVIYNRRQLRRTLTLQKELAEYERKALHLQMNPHFVFNCLGSISSFIVQNGTDSAIKYLSKFSKLMRLTLEYSKEALIPIDKEIEGLRNYLELEQLRFNQKFGFTITKSPDIEDDTALPPLLIQPFIENAIIHGVIPKNGGGNIDIGFRLQDGMLVCSVTDDGIGFEKSQELKADLVKVHKSMALDIIRKRLSMMQSNDKNAARVDIEQRTDSNGEAAGTKVVLTLPLQYIETK